jgi:hypothetical protein
MRIQMAIEPLDCCAKIIRLAGIACLEQKIWTMLATGHPNQIHRYTGRSKFLFKDFRLLNRNNGICVAMYEQKRSVIRANVGDG